MSKVATVKEVVKETLIGSKEPETAQLSAQTKARFNSHAVKDPETGDLFLGADEFIDAVAPPNEDYVSRSCLSHSMSLLQMLPVADGRSRMPSRDHRLTQSLSNSTRSRGNSTRSSSTLPTGKTRAR